MPAEITMPQQSDTMTEGTVVKWLKKEGDQVKAGDIIAEIETDKATMEMESFDAGTLAAILVKEGQKAPVGAPIAVLATAKDNPADIKQKYASGAPAPKASAAPAPTSKPAQSAAPAPQSLASSRLPPQSAPSPAPAPAKKTANYQYDVIVIGGGPAGYAAAIRAGQLKKRVLCVEKENLGGTCLNWGCIPTKALLEDGAFIRRMRTESAERGVTVGDIKVDFPKVVSRSRKIADKLKNGIGHLFKKYNVQSEMGVGELVAPHKVKATASDGKSKEFTAEHVIIAVGAKPVELPFAKFDGKQIITSREAMTLPSLPKRMAIIGAGAIGCEFADFYNSLGTQVTVVEMLPHLLPNEDEDVSILLERLFAKREMDVRVKTKTDKIEKTANGVRLTLSGEKAGTVEADVVLVAVGVAANTDGLAAQSGLELERGRVKVTPDYKTNLEDVYAVGDCIAMHWPADSSMGGYRHPDLAHVAHHEAVHLVDHLFGSCELNGNGKIDYKSIPGCTYTHPQVASMGATERKLREQNRQIKIGKFPFSASGRALAAGESDGFVKLIFDAQYGELLGVHMIGENVTELLAELVLAKKLEATEAEIIDAMHPHPTMSEAVMEAAGVADARAIHL